MTVDVAGPDGSRRQFQVDTAVTFDEDGLAVTGRVQLDDVAIGEPAVLWLERVALTVALRHRCETCGDVVEHVGVERGDLEGLRDRAGRGGVHRS